MSGDTSVVHVSTFLAEYSEKKQKLLRRGDLSPNGALALQAEADSVAPTWAYFHRHGLLDSTVSKGLVRGHLRAWFKHYISRYVRAGIDVPTYRDGRRSGPVDDEAPEIEPQAVETERRSVEEAILAPVMVNRLHLKLGDGSTTVLLAVKLAGFSYEELPACLRAAAGLDQTDAATAARELADAMAKKAIGARRVAVHRMTTAAVDILDAA